MNYGLVMIVKDEAEIIASTLRQVRPYISHWTIVDTGSTDGTQDIIRTELEGIPGTLHESEWVNFGVNRSEAFALARGTADWLIALDADMTFWMDPAFFPESKYDCYLLKMGTEQFSYRLPLLLRGDIAWKSVGAVHEYTTLADEDRLYNGRITDQVTISYPDRSGPDKTRWQAAMLEAEYERNPEDPRTVFYLAQTIRERNDDGDLEKARALYQVRSQMGGYDQEAWYAAYQAAALIPTAEARILGLIAVWEMRPHRLEPLHDALRSLNALGLHHAAYALSAVQGGTTDTLFVHKGSWEWGIPFERSIAAWWVGQKAECRTISLALLKVPSLPPDVAAAVRRNLELTPEDVSSKLVLPKSAKLRQMARA